MNTPATMTRSRAVLALLALGAGVCAAVARDPQPVAAADEIAAVELAGWIREQRPGLLLLDARSAALGEPDRLPRAQVLADFDPRSVAAAATIVVYAERGVDDGLRARLHDQLGERRLLRLRGGLRAWNDEVLFPQLRRDASATQRRAFEARAQLSRYFGGSPRVIEPGAQTQRSRSRRGC